jgi:ribose transport system permease protein
LVVSSESEEKMGKRPTFQGLFEIRESITIVILLVYILVLAVFNPIFFRPKNLMGIAFATSLLVPVVIGMHTLLATGAFDLSVGSVGALSGMVNALLLRETGSIPLSIAAGLGMGVLFGLINGLLVTKVRLNALIVTLATMGIARALTLGIVKGRVLARFPPGFAFLGQGMVVGIPVAVLIALVMIVVADFSFRKMRHCRRFYYVGSNEQAATYCGINASRVIQTAFLLSAGTAAFSGIVMSSRSMSSSPLVFKDLALEAIAACVIGGSSIRGGEGSVVGAIMGLLIIIITRNIMLLFDVSVYWKELVVGLILIVAVIGDYYADVRSRRGLVSEES